MSNRYRRAASGRFTAAKARPAYGDVVIIGAGLAGLFTALKLAPLPVTIIAAAPLGEGASSVWAQGGIAAAVGEGDTPEKHAADTIAAGAGIVDADIARMVAAEAPDRIADLLRYGVPFDRDLEGHFVLSKEAAHSEKRIVRVSGDRAGAAIMQALIAAVRASPHIRVLEGYEADELIMDDGAVEGVRLIRAAGHGAGAYEFMPAAAVVLATGGLGSLYALTTNPPYALGQAIAFAARAGAVIADPEFVQFHPTAIDVGLDPAPLATEALRGEGATLLNGRGERFMVTLDPAAELGARDVVARAVFNEIAGGRGAFLDCRTAIGARMASAYPTVTAHCRRAGIDPATELIPVAPAQHYHMGGIATDARARTSVSGLWAVGETSSTGLHGANRLASNSLLEAIVFGARAAADVRRLYSPGSVGHFVELRAVSGPAPSEPGRRERAVKRLRSIMSEKVGVVRSGRGLRAAYDELGSLAREAGTDGVLANMILAARFVTAGALLRKESRGGHYRTDYPQADVALAHRTFLTIEDLDVLDRAPITRDRALTLLDSRT